MYIILFAQFCQIVLNRKAKYILCIVLLAIVMDKVDACGVAELSRVYVTESVCFLKIPLGSRVRSRKPYVGWYASSQLVNDL